MNFRSLCIALLIAPLLLASTVCFGDQPLIVKGKRIYQLHCTKCHGDQGQGVADRYDETLTGSLSIAELAQLIAETMPEENPDHCTGNDAIAVATYIHGEFYDASQTQPRMQLSRLTATQLRQSLADLYAHFSGTTRFSERTGLRAEYYDGSRPRRDKRKINRVDATIDFDFADKGPGAGVNPKDFAIQWTGGLRVEETGPYELLIRSTCAFVCSLGDYDRELINNHVQSGDKTEFRRSMVLTAGRVYPLRIQFYQRKRKTEQPPARISLAWIPPHRTAQIVPARNLLAETVPATFSLQAKLPPDDRSYGYERGIAVDRQWDDSTTAAAIEFSQRASRELWPRYKRARRNFRSRFALRMFLKEMAETAFRGRVDDETVKLYIDDQIAASEDDAEAIRRSILIMLKSPRFLYPLLDHDRSRSQRAANRLALTLYDSLPADPWFIQLARRDKLATEAEIRAAARRMVQDYRLRAKAREMLHGWLDLSHVGSIEKDASAFPDFDNQLVSDLRSSLDATLDEVLWSDASDFRQLLQANWTYTTARLASFYGQQWQPGKGDLQKVLLPEERAIGLIGHPYLMSKLAYTDTSSPIHRGVFLIRNLLGRTLRPPQDAFTPLSPKMHPDLTTRERVALQTSPQNCQSCHAKINALGFTLENFDAVGRYQVKERDREIDTTGGYTLRNGEYAQIRGPQELAALLAASDDAHRAFVERAFEHFVKQPAGAFGADTLDDLTKSFRDSEFNIRELLVEIAVVAAFQPAS